MKKILVACLAASLTLPASVLAGPGSSIEGRVLAPAKGPAPSAVLAAGPAVGAAPMRTAVAPDGSFQLQGISEGRVELAVETADGLYVVDAPITLAPGTTRHVQLALKGRQDTSAPPDDSDKKKKGGSMWANPLTATTLVVGAAILTGLIIDQTDDDEPSNPASASSPLD